MKLFFFILFFISVSNTACLHSIMKNAEPTNDATFRSEQTFEPDILKKLKATKTVFFLQENLGAARDSFKQAIQSAWTLTPIIFEDPSNFTKYASDPAYSYFDIESSTLIVDGQIRDFSYTHYYLTLRLFKDIDKKGKINTYGLCHIELSPDYSASFSKNGNRTYKSSEQIIKNNFFYNFTPAIIEAHLVTVQNQLNQSMRQSLFKEIKDDNLTGTLSKNTLYIPKRLMVDYSGISIIQTPKKENVFAGYPYKYKICTDEELYQIFETNKTGTVLFEFIQCEGQKWVSIINVKTGKKIYMVYTPQSRNLNSKDIDKISK